MDIIEEVGYPAVLEQLGEECAELNHACLKYARILRGENPTPVSESIASVHVMEEAGDVMACIMVALSQEDLDLAREVALEKIARWEERIQDAKKNPGNRRSS